MAIGFNEVICIPLLNVPAVPKKAAGGIVTMVTWFAVTVKGMDEKLLSAIATVPEVLAVDVI